MTPSQARNAIKRALKEIVDPTPSEKEIMKLWDYFGSTCCYCGKSIVPDDRTGHIDHLVPESQGGKNSIENRVLSCSRCNGDEKLDLNWESFLQRICGDDSRLCNLRKDKIEKWINKRHLTITVANKKDIESAFEEVDTILSNVIARLRTSCATA